MVERYIKTLEEHLRKVVASHPRDWNGSLPLVFLVYRASIHDSMGLTPACLLFGRELRLPCDLIFGATPDKKRSTIDHAAELVDHLHDIHDYARQQLNLASDRMKTRYDKLAYCAGYHEGDCVCHYRPTRNKKKLPNLQSSWDCPYNLITRINDLVYKIQKTPRSRMMVVHLDRLATYYGVDGDEHTSRRGR
jgi:hypothetical protein